MCLSFFQLAYDIPSLRECESFSQPNNRRCFVGLLGLMTASLIIPGHHLIRADLSVDSRYKDTWSDPLNHAQICPNLSCALRNFRVDPDYLLEDESHFKDATRTAKH